MPTQRELEFAERSNQLDREYQRQRAESSGGEMGNLGGTLILLVVALALLYLAVTDRLSNFLDGVEVAIGKKKVASNTTGAALQTSMAMPTATNITVGLPSLPSLNNAQVQA